LRKAAIFESSLIQRNYNNQSGKNIYDDLILGTGSISIEKLLGERNQERTLIMEVKLSPREKKPSEQKTMKPATITIKFSLNNVNKSPLKSSPHVEESDRRIPNENGLSPGMLFTALKKCII
jgi:hypothetical protein